MKKLLLIGLLFNVGFAYCQNPIAHYKFNDTIESSGANNHLMKTGTGTNYNFIKDGATRLNSDTCINFSYGKGLVSKNSLNNKSWTGTSISLWYNSNHPNTTGFIIQGAYMGFGIKMEASGQVSAFFSGTSATSVYSTSPIDDGVWHHVVAQTNGTNTTTIYIDGKLDKIQAENCYRMSGPDPAAKLYFGNTVGNNAADKLVGKVDELKLYDDALSVSQITKLYQYGYQLAFPETQNLIVHYKFSDTLESSGTGNYLLPHGSKTPYSFSGPGASGLSTDSFVSFAEGKGLTTYYPLYNKNWPATSISFWFNSKSTYSGYIVQGAYMGFGVRMQSNGSISTFFGGTSASSLISNETIRDGEWHHIVAQNNGSISEIYIDGVLDRSRSEKPYIMQSAISYAGLYFGNSVGNFNEDKLTGKLDEFRLYKTLLTTSEIKDLHKYGKKPLGINEFAATDLSISVINSGSSLKINTTENIEVVLIHNIHGTLVQSENNNTFSIEQLTAGLYIMQIKTEKGITKKRFVKE